jgi:hypothetical protein
MYSHEQHKCPTQLHKFVKIKKYYTRADRYFTYIVYSGVFFIKYSMHEYIFCMCVRQCQRVHTVHKNTLHTCTYSLLYMTEYSEIQRISNKKIIYAAFLEKCKSTKLSFTFILVEILQNWIRSQENLAFHKIFNNLFRNHSFKTWTFDNPFIFIPYNDLVLYRFQECSPFIRTVRHGEAAVGRLVGPLWAVSC